MKLNINILLSHPVCDAKPHKMGLIIFTISSFVIRHINVRRFAASYTQRFIIVITQWAGLLSL